MTCECCFDRRTVTMTVSVFWDGGWFPDYLEVPCPGCQPEADLYEPPDDCPDPDVLPAFELAYQY